MTILNLKGRERKFEEEKSSALNSISTIPSSVSVSFSSGSDHIPVSSSKTKRKLSVNPDIKEKEMIFDGPDNGFASSINSYDNVTKKEKIVNKNIKKENDQANNSSSEGQTESLLHDHSTLKKIKASTSHTSDLEAKSKADILARRSSEVIRLLENKLCEGSLMLYNVSDKSWRKIYVVLTKTHLYLYHFKKEYEISRMGYKTGKSRITLGKMVRDPVLVSTGGLHLCHLPEQYLQRKCTFRVSNNFFSVFLSTCLNGNKNKSVGKTKKPNKSRSSIGNYERDTELDHPLSSLVELNLMKRWSKVIQRVGAKVDLATCPPGLYPQPIEDDILSCIHCGSNVNRYRRHLQEEKDKFKQEETKNKERDLQVVFNRNLEEAKEGRKQDGAKGNQEDYYSVNFEIGKEMQKEMKNEKEEIERNERSKTITEEESNNQDIMEIEFLENPFYEEDLIAFYPKPASRGLISEIPCAFLKTSFLQCERCQVIVESLRLKRVHMNYRRYDLMLKKGGNNFNERRTEEEKNRQQEDKNKAMGSQWNYSSYKHDPMLKKYFDQEDINKAEWPLELPPAIPVLETDIIHGRKQEESSLLLRRGNPPEIPVNEYKAKGLFAPPLVAGKGKRKIFG